MNKDPRNKVRTGYPTHHLVETDITSSPSSVLDSQACLPLQSATFVKNSNQFIVSEKCKVQHAEEARSSQQQVVSSSDYIFDEGSLTSFESSETRILPPEEATSNSFGNMLPFPLFLLVVSSILWSSYLYLDHHFSSEASPLLSTKLKQKSHPSVAVAVSVPSPASVPVPPRPLMVSGGIGTGLLTMNNQQAEVFKRFSPLFFNAIIHFHDFKSKDLLINRLELLENISILLQYLLSSSSCSSSSSSTVSSVNHTSYDFIIRLGDVGDDVDDDETTRKGKPPLNKQAVSSTNSSLSGSYTSSSSSSVSSLLPFDPEALSPSSKKKKKKSNSERTVELLLNLYDYYSQLSLSSHQNRLIEKLSSTVLTQQVYLAFFSFIMTPLLLWKPQSMLLFNNITYENILTCYDKILTFSEKSGNLSLFYYEIPSFHSSLNQKMLLFYSSDVTMMKERKEEALFAADAKIPEVPSQVEEEQVQEQEQERKGMEKQDDYQRFICTDPFTVDVMTSSLDSHSSSSSPTTSSASFVSSLTSGSSASISRLIENHPQELSSPFCEAVQDQEGLIKKSDKQHHGGLIYRVKLIPLSVDGMKFYSFIRTFDRLIPSPSPVLSTTSFSSSSAASSISPIPPVIKPSLSSNSASSNPSIPSYLRRTTVATTSTPSSSFSSIPLKKRWSLTSLHDNSYSSNKNQTKKQQDIRCTDKKAMKNETKACLQQQLQMKSKVIPMEETDDDTVEDRIISKNVVSDSEEEEEVDDDNDDLQTLFNQTSQKKIPTIEQENVPKRKKSNNPFSDYKKRKGTTTAVKKQVVKPSMRQVTPFKNNSKIRSLPPPAYDAAYDASMTLSTSCSYFSQNDDSHQISPLTKRQKHSPSASHFSQSVMSVKDGRIQMKNKGENISIKEGGEEGEEDEMEVIVPDVSKGKEKGKWTESDHPSINTRVAKVDVEATSLLLKKLQLTKQYSSAVVGYSSFASSALSVSPSFESLSSLSTLSTSPSPSPLMITIPASVNNNKQKKGRKSEKEVDDNSDINFDDDDLLIENGDIERYRKGILIGEVVAFYELSSVSSSCTSSTSSVSSSPSFSPDDPSVDSDAISGFTDNNLLPRYRIVWENEEKLEMSDSFYRNAVSLYNSYYGWITNHEVIGQHVAKYFYFSQPASSSSSKRKGKLSNSTPSKKKVSGRKRKIEDQADDVDDEEDGEELDAERQNQQEDCRKVFFGIVTKYAPPEEEAEERESKENNIHSTPNHCNINKVEGCDDSSRHKGELFHIEWEDGDQEDMDFFEFQSGRQLYNSLKVGSSSSSHGKGGNHRPSLERKRKMLLIDKEIAKQQQEMKGEGGIKRSPKKKQGGEEVKKNKEESLSLASYDFQSYF
jgi:hypothetical protein